MKCKRQIEMAYFHWTPLGSKPVKLVAQFWELNGESY